MLLVLLVLLLLLTLSLSLECSNCESSGLSIFSAENAPEEDNDGGPEDNGFPEV